jgi:endonuclease/exonuclease/phosphatase (EEP) superfamily protein YafD
VPTTKVAEVKPAKKRRAISIISYTFLAVVVLVLVLVKLLGDRWMPATILLFAPRWVYLFPLPILGIWAGLQRKWRALAIQGITFVLVAGPLMGLCIPLGRLFSSTPQGEHIRVLSLNRGTGTLDSKAFTQLLANGRYNVCCIQEFRPDPVLDQYFTATGWKRNKNGSIWSQFPIAEDLGELPTEDYEIHGAWPVRLSRVIIQTKGGSKVLIANAHMPTMTYAFEGLAKGELAWFHYYVGWRSRQVDKLIEVLNQYQWGSVILAADFNMPPDSPFMKRIRSRYPSGFEEVGWGYGYTRPSRESARSSAQTTGRLTPRLFFRTHLKSSSPRAHRLHLTTVSICCEAWRDAGPSRSVRLSLQL